MMLLPWSMTACAQQAVTAECNFWRPQDCLVRQQICYQHPGRSGEDVLWDISHQELIDDNYKQEVFPDEECPDTFSVVMTDFGTAYTWRVKNDSLQLMRTENSTTLIEYVIPETHLVYPMEFGDSFKSVFCGTGSYCEKIFFRTFGTVTTTADATGTLILPDGDTLSHVIRLHTTRIISDRKYPLAEDMADIHEYCHSSQKIAPDSIPFLVASSDAPIRSDIYSWYADGYRYPIFQTIGTATGTADKDRPSHHTAFYYPPTRQLTLPFDPVNEKRRTPDNSSSREKNEDHATEEKAKTDAVVFRYNLIPSHSNETATLSWFLSSTAEISWHIYTTGGILIDEHSPFKASAGTHSELINLSSEAGPVLIADINVDGRHYSCKVAR